MRKEEENSEEKFPWLDDTDERKYMMDREILDKYVNLGQFMFDQNREKAGERLTVQVQRCIQP